MDKSREQFDEWFNREKLSGITNESMIMVIRECMYEGWQASKAALVVKLPRMPYYDFDSLEIEYALDEVGVKYEWVKK